MHGEYSTKPQKVQYTLTQMSGVKGEQKVFWWKEIPRNCGVRKLLNIHFSLQRRMACMRTPQMQARDMNSDS